jgi:hypothetical protein
MIEKSPVLGRHRRGAKPKAVMRANFISPRYTTDWAELPVVR